MTVNNRQIKTNGGASEQKVILTVKKDATIAGKEYKVGEQIPCSKSVAIELVKQSGKVFDIKMD